MSLGFRSTGSGFVTVKAKGTVYLTTKRMCFVANAPVPLAGGLTFRALVSEGVTVSACVCLCVPVCVHVCLRMGLTAATCCTRARLPNLHCVCACVRVCDYESLFVCAILLLAWTP